MAGGIHVLGAGAMGCLVAALAQRAGIPATLLLRTEQSVQQFHKAGSCISLQASVSCGDSVSHVSCAAELAATGCSTNPSQQQPPAPISHLVVATKAQHTADALASVQHRLLPSSSVLLLQNGTLAVAQAVRQRLPQTQRSTPLLAGIVTHGAFRTAAFSVVHAGHGSILVGAVLADDHLQSSAAPSTQLQRASSARLLGILSAVPGLGVKPVHDPAEFRRQLLVKLAVNCCINPLTALYGCHNGALQTNAHLLSLVSHVCSELVLAFGSDLRMDALQLQQHVEQVARQTAQNRSSMLQDITALRSTEVDFLTGYVVAEAGERGVDAPVNSTLLTLIHAKEQLVLSGLLQESG